MRCDRPVGGANLVAWRAAQIAIWSGSMAVLAALLFWPSIGLLVFWGVLIPLAPAVLAVAPGLWRNICPLASTALLPRHLGFSRRFTLPEAWQGRLQLVSVLVLLAVAPLRHVVLNQNGAVTVAAFSVLALMAFTGGLLFEWKSGWCSTICPMHPVEKLYAAEPLVSVVNAHCEPCESCTSLCPDSTPGIDALTACDSPSGRAAAVLITGGFAGFVWGWFQVPDYAGTEGWEHLGTAYGLPYLGLGVTLSLFVVLRLVVPWEQEWRLVRVFGAAAISCYFWFRLPALFGFGIHSGDGVLVDLSGTLPEWFPVVSRVVTTGFFAWWLAIRGTGTRAW